MSTGIGLIERGEARTVELRAKLFRGLANLSRLSILDALRGGARPVGDIVAATGLSQSNVSNHLRCLSECGLVASEQRGRFVHYRLSDPRLDDLLAIADELLMKAASGVDTCERYRSGSP